MFDSIHEECGVFGIFEPKKRNVAHDLYVALYALQHRGQESAGIAVCDDGVITYEKGAGLVSEVFSKEVLQRLNNGHMAVGHVRYSTTGGNNINNIQPLVVRHMKGNLALVHNGNLTNADELRKKFELNGAIFHGTSDTESIAYSIVDNRLTSSSIEHAIEKTMNDIKGAYSCIAMSPTKMVGFRDPNGFRPLCLGRSKDGGYILSSESCAIDACEGTFIRDILPGEIIVISEDGIESINTHVNNRKHTICVFEYIYFARGDSYIEGVNVHDARVTAGKILAEENKIDADVVIGVPDSGLDAALGYSMASNIPYGMGFVKNKYIGRSFIKPSQEERRNTVKIKLNVVKSVVNGKRVVLVDDSIVRGTTSKEIIKLLREAGAKEVHFLSSAPAFKHPCYFGTDVDSEENLIACKYKTNQEIAEALGADSLSYLSLEGSHKLAIKEGLYFCDGCFSGNYPIDVPTEVEKNKFEQKITK